MYLIIFNHKELFEELQNSLHSEYWGYLPSGHGQGVEVLVI